MKKISVETCVEGGKIKKRTNTIKKMIEHFEGKEIIISIELKTKKRSIKQNSYYWGGIIPIVKELLQDSQGEFYSKEEVHEFLKNNFNFKELINEDTGEVLRIPLSTIENDTFQQEQYHEKIRRFAFEFFDCVIPLPNEKLKLEL